MKENLSTIINHENTTKDSAKHLLKEYTDTPILKVLNRELELCTHQPYNVCI